MSLASVDMKQLMADLRAACVDLACVEASPHARSARADLAPPAALDGALDAAERHLLVLREVQPGPEAERAVRWVWMAQGRLQRYPRPLTWERAAAWGEDLGWLVASAAGALPDAVVAAPADEAHAGAVTALRTSARLCREWAAQARTAAERAARAAAPKAAGASLAACCG